MKKREWIYIAVILLLLGANFLKSTETIEVPVIEYRDTTIVKTDTLLRDVIKTIKGKERIVRDSFIRIDSVTFVDSFILIDTIRYVEKRYIDDIIKYRTYNGQKEGVEWSVSTLGYMESLTIKPPPETIEHRTSLYTGLGYNSSHGTVANFAISGGKFNAYASGNWKGFEVSLMKRLK